MKHDQRIFFEICVVVSSWEGVFGLGCPHWNALIPSVIDFLFQLFN